MVISGSGFSLLTLDWVNFGPAASVSSEVTKVLSLTANAIVIAPPASEVSRPDALELPGGVSVQSLAGLSNVEPLFYAGTPVVLRLDTPGGPVSGGTRLHIVGAGLDDVTSLTLISELSGTRVSLHAQSLRERANGELTVVMPADEAGPVAVVPCSLAGCAKSKRSVDTFVYFKPHSSSLAISPSSGPASGGTKVLLFGDGVGRASSVVIGSVAAPVHPATLYPAGDPYVGEAVTPPGAAIKRVAVTATIPNRSRPMRGSFRYLPSAPSCRVGHRPFCSRHCHTELEPAGERRGIGHYFLRRRRDDARAPRAQMDPRAASSFVDPHRARCGSFVRGQHRRREPGPR